MSSRMLAGTTGLNEGKQAHLLDVQCILYEVWNNMEVSTIARSWAKAGILPITMEADIRAEHGSRTKCVISKETKESIDDIITSLSRIALLGPFSSDDDDLTASVLGLLELQGASSKGDLERELEIWTQIEETQDFIELQAQEVEESISEEAFILSLTTESPTTQCEDLEPSNEEPEGGVKSILDLDANSLCRSLVELQEVLDHHGVNDAAECIEKGRNLLIQASWKAKSKVAVQNRQTTMDAFLMK